MIEINWFEVRRLFFTGAVTCVWLLFMGLVYSMPEASVLAVNCDSGSFRHDDPLIAGVSGEVRLWAWGLASLTYVGMLTFLFTAERKK
jgi:hypothetical protein